MRCAMCCESLVLSTQARSTRPIRPRCSALRCGVSSTSEPQAEPTSRPGAPSTVVASQASVPCEVR